MVSHDGFNDVCVFICRLRICGVGECSFYEPDDETCLCQPIFAQMLLDPYEEFLRYLQRQRPCPVCHSFVSFKMFSDDLLNVLAQCQCQLFLFLAHFDVQRLRDHGTEVFLLFVHELILLSAFASEVYPKRRHKAIHHKQ